MKIIAAPSEFARLEKNSKKSIFIKGTSRANIREDKWIHIRNCGNNEQILRPISGIFDTKITIAKSKVQFWIRDKKGYNLGWKDAVDDYGWLNSLGYHSFITFFASHYNDLNLKPTTDKIHGVTVIIE